MNISDVDMWPLCVPEHVTFTVQSTSSTLSFNQRLIEALDRHNINLQMHLDIVNMINKIKSRLYADKCWRQTGAADNVVSEILLTFSASSQNLI